MENEAKKELTLEDGLEKLEEITRQMEDPKLSLEERFDLYKAGMDLIKICTEKIDMVEKKLEIIQKDGN